MDIPQLDAIVIGAGHAGLSISYHLKKLNLEHLVFEKGKIGNSWITQRWDSFKLNTPNKTNLLPGEGNIFPDEEGFCTAGEFVSFLRQYSEKFHLPVVENCRVLSVENVNGSKDFLVSVSENGSVRKYRSKKIMVASGGLNKKIIPPFAKKVSPKIFQLHAGDYRRDSLLPGGNVLIVGSAQSGLQIAEDLIGRGRKVFVSTSQVPRVPRRYRGKDIVEWLILTGFWDTYTSDVTDARIFLTKQAQISAVGQRGHTLSLQALARKGAVILGKTDNADGITVYLQGNAAEHVKFADDSSRKMKENVDEYIRISELFAPAPEVDPDDSPDEIAACATSVSSLNFAENNISSVIWATGFAGDFSYLKLPVFNGQGILEPNNGISDIEGLSFIGLPWLRKRKSGIVLGIRDDAEFIVESQLQALHQHVPGWE